MVHRVPPTSTLIIIISLLYMNNLSVYVQVYKSQRIKIQIQIYKYTNHNV